MRLIGTAERALEAMCRRVTSRVAFGKPLAEQGTIRADIAESRMEIAQARLLTLEAAYLMDTVGNRAARGEIAMIKVVVPRMALRVIDRAIQAHGAAGVSDDFGLASAWAHSRTIGSRMADEVHREVDRGSRRELVKATTDRVRIKPGATGVSRTESSPSSPSLPPPAASRWCCQVVVPCAHRSPRLSTPRLRQGHPAADVNHARRAPDRSPPAAATRGS
jgi:hypothetical protein